MSTIKAGYNKIDAEFWAIIHEIDELDSRRNDLDVNHYMDSDYAGKIAAIESRREILVSASHELGARLDGEKKKLIAASPLMKIMQATRK